MTDYDEGLFTRVITAWTRLQTSASPFTLWFDIFDYVRMIINSILIAATVCPGGD